MKITFQNSVFKVQNSVSAGGRQTYGLYLDFCSGFTVEKNEFYTVYDRPEGYGLIINQSGTNDNEVYNNSFHNLHYATQAQRCNRYSYPYNGGLCYRCNDFFENENDIFVISDAPPGARDQGISLSQGNKTHAAKNTFTGGNNEGYDIYNPFDVIQYFQDQHSNGYNITPYPIVGVTNKFVELSWYNKYADCPSHFKTLIDIPELTAELAEADINADSVQTILMGLIDGGSTEELISEVQTSTPPEAFEIRNDLMAQSPYLSDSVMQAAIAKEDVLPNVMIRDILVENPQSAKSDALIEALDQRFIPMPDSMMAQIMEGEGIFGAKEEQEQELIKWNSKYAVAMKNLIRLYDQDTTGTYGTDSLISMINHDGSLQTRYDLVSLYYSKCAFETGNYILNTIPSEFTLSDNQELTHELYVALFPYLYQVVSDSNGLWSLDSTQISVLNTLALNDNSLPGAYARNLLIKKGLLQYEEPILLVSSLKESKKWRSGSDNPSLGNDKDFWLKVYPNPANYYFIVEYRSIKQINPGYKLSITVTDIKGREFFNFPLNKNFDRFVIPTEKLNAGAYIIGLNVNAKQKEQVKLIIK
ncbi:MAG: T9SS type A sorting domain-containing protein [Bacteroidales bacterium]|nr:T9SS type A sorting domain-containing protein [Bacteroidales bacterium]